MNIDNLKLAPQTRIAEHTVLAHQFFREVMDRDFSEAVITDQSLLSHFGPFYYAECVEEEALHTEWCELVVRMVDMAYGVKLTDADVTFADLFDAIVARRLKAVH